MSALTKIAFRKIGHFYEAFNDDARTIAPILELTLTERNGVPMCGFPYHMLDMCEKNATSERYRVAGSILNPSQ